MLGTLPIERIGGDGDAGVQIADGNRQRLPRLRKVRKITRFGKPVEVVDSIDLRSGPDAFAPGIGSDCRLHLHHGDHETHRQDDREAQSCHQRNQLSLKIGLLSFASHGCRYSPYMVQNNINGAPQIVPVGGAFSMGRRLTTYAPTTPERRG